MKAINNLPELITLKELTKYLRVHYTTILRYIKKGKIKAIKIGKSYRVSRKEVNNVLLNDPFYERD